MGEEKYIVKTWKEIAKYTPYNDQTLRKRFGKDMLVNGIVIKSRLGSRGRVYCWAYPELIKRYFVLRGQKNVEKNSVL